MPASPREVVYYARDVPGQAQWCSQGSVTLLTAEWPHCTQTGSQSRQNWRWLTTLCPIQRLAGPQEQAQANRLLSSEEAVANETWWPNPIYRLWIKH